MINTDDECHKASLPLRGLHVMEGYLFLPVSGYMDFTVQLCSMWRRAKVSLDGKIVEKTNIGGLQYF